MSRYLFFAAINSIVAVAPATRVESKGKKNR
jgi:hypothetical protein